MLLHFLTANCGAEVTEQLVGPRAFASGAPGSRGLGSEGDEEHTGGWARARAARRRPAFLMGTCVSAPPAGFLSLASPARGRGRAGA